MRVENSGPLGFGVRCPYPEGPVAMTLNMAKLCRQNELSALQ